MTNENFEVVDRDYGNCHEINAPRKIRTKSSSFTSISSKFNNFRVKLLQNKLDRIQNKALTDNYNQENFLKKLDKKALSVAKLEEKIMILSKEDVPNNYVSSRALKLRNNMFKNLSYKSGSFYSIGLDKKEMIFENSDDAEPIMLETNVSNDTKIESDVDLAENAKIDVVPNSLERQQIEDAVNSEFDLLSNEQSSDSDVADEIEEYNSNFDFISSNDVRSAIDEKFDEMEFSPKIVKTYTGDDNNTTGSEINENVVVESNDNNEKQSGVPIIVSSDFTDDGKSFEIVGDYNGKINDVIEKIKISRNNSNSAKMSHYDENGNRRQRSGYVPMTDEEIRLSQEKLGFDSNGNLIPTIETPKEKGVSTASVIGKNITPFVIPNLSFDAVFVPSKKNDLSNNREFAEDSSLSRDDANEVENTDIHSTKSDETTLLELKKKIEELKLRKSEIGKRRLAAQEAAEDAAARALEAKKMFEESQENYDTKMRSLRDYTAELEEDCNRDMKIIELTENDAIMNNNFASTQYEKASQNYRKIDEIDLLLGLSEENNKSDSKVK